MRRIGWFVAVLTLMCGCDWTADGLARLEQKYPTDVANTVNSDAAVTDVTVADSDNMPDVFGEAIGDASEPEAISAPLEGLWAVRLVSQGTIAPIGTPWALTTTDLFLGEVSADESTLTLTFCGQTNVVDQGSGPSDFGKAEVPTALEQALRAAPIVIALPGDQTFGTPSVVWLWGLKDMADPALDPIPESGSDARVFDQDQDGQVGVTMHVAMPEGDRYMVRRVVWQFAAGAFQGDANRFGGRLAFTADEKAYGASNTLLTTVANITPTPDASAYLMRRLDAAISCDALKADQTNLFDVP